MNVTEADIKLTHVTKTLAHGAPLVSCRFDPTGKWAFASSQDYTLVRWNLANDAKIAYAGHEGWIYAIGFSGQSVLTAGGDGRLMWWPVAEEKPTAQRTIQAHDGWARCLAASIDGQLLATGGNDNLVKLWSAADGKPVHTLKGHANRVYSVLFHPDGKHLLSGDLMGSVRIWELTSGKEVGSLDAKELHTFERGQGVDFGGVRGLTVTPNHNRVSCGGLYKASNPLGAVHEPLVVNFDWATRKKINTHIAPGVPGGVLWRLRYLSDQLLVGVSGGTTGGLLFFWKPDQEKDIHRFGLPNIARDVDVHPTQPVVATAHQDGKLRLSRLAGAG